MGGREFGFGSLIRGLNLGFEVVGSVILDRIFVFFRYFYYEYI